jgi:hypothetical protein
MQGKCLCWHFQSVLCGTLSNPHELKSHERRRMVERNTTAAVSLLW